METYKYGENTLLHSINFNPYKLESILKNGILSKKKADSMGIPLARNNFGYNFEDRISMTRPLYSSDTDERSILHTWVPKNITFIVEDQEFIFDRNDAYFNHADEVFVDDIVPPNKIVGIMIPEKYQDYQIRDLAMIPLKSTSYMNMKDTCDQLIEYLKTMGHEIDEEEYKNLLGELMLTIFELNKEPENQELQDDFMDIKLALNEFMASETQITFDKALNKEDCTLMDMVNYINNKTLNLPLYGVHKQLTK